MGYDVHISRKEYWSDEVGPEITLAEWQDYVESDPEMRLDGYAETELANGTLRIEDEGIAVWIAYSKHLQDKNMAWFGFSGGMVDVKNPDDEILKKMYQISLELGAKVQGDEGEIYDESGQSNWNELRSEGKSTGASSRGRWWQFWK